MTLWELFARQGIFGMAAPIAYVLLLATAVALAVRRGREAGGVWWAGAGLVAAALCAMLARNAVSWFGAEGAAAAQMLAASLAALLAAIFGAAGLMALAVGVLAIARFDRRRLAADLLWIAALLLIAAAARTLFNGMVAGPAG